MRFLGQIEENQPEIKYMGPLISERVEQPFATLSPQEGLFEGQAEITPYGVKVKPYFNSEDDLPEQNQKIERSKILSTTLNIPFSAVYDNEEELSKEFQKHDSSWMKTATNSFKRGIGNTYTTFGRALQLTGMKDFGEDFVAYGKGLQHIYAPPLKPTEFTFDKVLTPEFWANDVAESIPFTLSLIPAALIAGYAGAGTAGAIGLGVFGKVVLGSIGAGVVSRTIESALEAAGTYDEALTAGESDEEARTRADYTFKHNLVPLTGSDIAQFLIAFTPLGKMGGENILAKRIAATVVKLGAVGAMEAGEEVWQERVQQIARGERPHVSPEMKEAGVIGAIFGLGLGGTGSVWTAMTERVANTASPKLLQVYEETKNAQISMGVTPEEAHLAGLDAMAEIPEGKIHIEKVMTEIKDMAEGKTVEDEVVKKETKEAEQFIEKSEEIDVLTDEDIKSIAEGRESIDVISERLGEEEVESEVSREMAKYLEVDKEFVELRDKAMKGETLTESELKRYEDLKFEVPYRMEKAGISGKEVQPEARVEETKSGEIFEGKYVWQNTVESVPKYIVDLIEDAGKFFTEKFGKNEPSKTGRYSTNLLTRETAPYATGGKGGAKIGITNREEGIHDTWAKTNGLDFVSDSADAWNVHNAFHEWLHNKMKGAKEETIQKETIKATKEYFEKAEAKEKMFISEETYEKAKKSLKEKLSPGTLRAGIDPTAISDLAVMGAYHIERGVRKFGEWSKTMIKEFGEEIRPYLRKIWKDANAYIEEKVPTKKVKGLIRETTGQVSLSNLIREDVALSAAMKKAEQNARIAYREGKKDALEKVKAEFRGVLLKARIKAEVFAFKEGFRVGSRLTATHLIQGFKDDQVTAKETRNMLTNYIEENLPPDLRGKFLNAIIQNMTKKKQASIWQRVDKTREELEHKKAVAEIVELKELKGDISLDYQKKVIELIGDIDTKKITSKTFERLKGLKDYIEKNGVPSGIKNETLDKMKRLEMRGAEEMTTEELKFLADTATHLTNLGKLKQELKYKYNERVRRVATDKLLISTFNLDPELTGEDTLMDKVKKGTMFLYLDTLQNPRVADMIDGYQNYRGENAKHIKTLIAKETKAILNTRTIIDSAVQEMIDAGLGELTEEQQQKVMINIRNIEGAFDQVKTLMENYGYKDIPTLTKEESKIIDILKKYTNQYAGQIGATYEEIENKEFVKLENYILPIKYEKEFNIIPAEAIEQSRHRTTQTFKGFTTERQQGVKRLPRVDILGLFEEAINEQQWYIQMQPELENIKYLVKSKEYIEKAGELAGNWWRDHLDMVARRGNSATASHTPFTNLLRQFRFNLNKAILGYKLSSIVMQPFAIIDATAYTQAKYGSLATLEIIKEFTKAFVVPQYAKDFIDTSPALQVRKGGEVAIQETLEKIGRSESFSNKFIKGGLSLLQKADVRTSAGVEMGLLNVLEKYNIPNAKEEAEFLMNMVSSSSEVTFRPHILARGEGAKTWFTFQTFFLNRWGLIAHDLISSGLIHGEWKAKYSAMLGLGIIVAGAIAEDEARKFMYEKITRRKMPDKIDLLEDIIFAIPRNIPFFGNFLDFSGKSEIPIMRVFENLFKGKNVITGKTSESKVRGLIKSLESIATLTGISGTAQFFDLMEGIFLGEEEKAPAKPKFVKPKLKR